MGCNMNREEYEQRKRRLEEQLREGIELLQAGFRQQLRALEMVWMSTSEEDGVQPQPQVAGTKPLEPAAASAAPKQPRRRRMEPGKLLEDVENALDSVPQHFDRHDLLKILGYEPDRSSLHRVMKVLLKEGVITLESYSAGKIPAKYEKSGSSGS